MDFYDRVKESLRAKSISIKGMCEKLDISLETYNTNRGRNMMPRLDVVTRIASFLGESIDYLATGHTIAPLTDVPNWQHLNEKQRHAIHQFVTLDTKTERFEDLCEDIDRAYRRQQNDNLANHVHG
ncbi:helix-turn-helix domain-containing protein (plasmid) [Entomospira nematocerorum]|uniref:Helix-turn-helix transcriptional regulator n=1 Tax=Entomospira nematocerorum TaxID=2719987 RepID=A0A968KTW6_9SPIO|nr:helix-turn-helix domain-containing protein [Entomospira nematocera]NIZ47791.1 helix-turn-helix transcriptional regulator [Entomospira nematocera]WDI34769.1 helix-turn-helix domain-containing protein [Entomospira nematocera]